MHNIEYSDGNVIQLEFDEAKHWYKVDGEYVPSVTGILRATIAKPALMYWAVNCAANYLDDLISEEGSINSNDWASVKADMKKAHNKVSSHAQTIGKIAHKYAEDAVSWKLGNSTEIPAVPEEVEAKNSVHAFTSWVKSNDIKWLGSEEKIYHRHLDYAGTVDAVAEINDEFCVIDWKTGSNIYEEMYLQCAAYAKCIEDMHGREVDAFYILRLDKTTGKHQAVRSSEIDKYFDAFKHSLGLYRALNDLKNKGK
jgi:hypothetical protein